MAGRLHSRGPHKYQSQRTLWSSVTGKGAELIAYRTEEGGVVKWKDGTAGTGATTTILRCSSFDEAIKRMLEIYTQKLKDGWTSKKSEASVSQIQRNLKAVLDKA